MHSNGFIHNAALLKAALAAVFATSLAVGTASGAAAAGGSASKTGSPTGPLTTGQLTKALPTDLDLSGFTYTATEDTTALTTTPTSLTSGGVACQKLFDASAGLSTTYGTVAEAERTLHETAGAGRTVHVRILSFASADAAKAVLADVKAGVGGCSYASDSTTTLAIAAIPQLANKPDRVGYAAVATTSGKSVFVGDETVQDGSAIVEATITGPVTQDTNALEAMGTVISTASDATTGKLDSV
jgi:hypothetical protein